MLESEMMVKHRLIF